jgi:hypothetical protein
MARSIIKHRALSLLQLRKELANRYSQFCARFKDAGAGAYQGEVLAIGDLDQPVEDRVVEHLPPRHLAGDRTGQDREPDG